ncbi:hypothetical protein F4802DRAFT_602447 [Xylaria palmicola]|nr:hypothetical protein F4802DRAFT_602447 [Xylaria palmicola]
MPWPPGPNQAEEAKPNIHPSALTRWDMHDQSLMFGCLGGLEHGLVLIRKIIDFDNAALVDEEARPNDEHMEDFDDELGLRDIAKRKE